MAVLFIIGAIPALVLRVVMYFSLDDRVAYAKWLSADEKGLVAAEIAQERNSKTH